MIAHPLTSRHKYGVAPKEQRTCLIDGKPVVFASKGEMRRWGELVLMERAGKITNLVRQPRYQLVLNGVKIGAYVGDFSYFKEPNGDFEVEDYKGVRTSVYQMKRKLMLALYGITIREVSAK